MTDGDGDDQILILLAGRILVEADDLAEVQGVMHGLNGGSVGRLAGLASGDMNVPAELEVIFGHIALRSSPSVVTPS